MLNKYDIGLILVVLACAGLMIFGLGQNQNGSINKLKISVDGKEYASYDPTINQKINLDIDGRHNELEIKDGKVKMIEADCPDGYCLKQGSISQSHETIVCLPNRVIVEFTENHSSVDTVVG